MTPLQEMKLMAEAGERARLSLTAERDALAAQRDEGLAREELMRLGYEQCKQRLAEAENPLRSLDQSWNYHNGRAGHSETMVKVEKFLVAPGCADGEPTK